MSGYNSTLQVYYCKQTESPGASHRIAPAPQITINPEIYYANDNVIGYTYNITLNGYANALRKEVDESSVNYGLSGVVSHIGDLREIFNTNGGNLYVKRDNQNILVAKGATIKSVEFSESDNKWFNYSPFTVQIEFNEVDLIGCDNNPTISCSSSLFHQIENAKNISDKLIDITKYKIKEFSDKWTFTIDNRIYENYEDLYNNVFTVNYTLSATGKNYYVNDNLVPAWQQARLFVQDKLYDQISSLVNGQLQIESNNDSACQATKDLSQIHDVDKISPRQNGLLQDLNTLKDGNVKYDVYNENITCDTSESNGTFSVTYQSTIKKNNSALNPLVNAALHTFTKDVNTTLEQKIDSSISVKGTIQGLVRGGFIYYNNNFILPKSGTFITSVDSAETKYNNALNYYNTIVGDSSDLLPSFKSKINVTKSQLLMKGTDGLPIPSTFVLDHNYNEGSISYTATYEKSLATALEKGFSNISIVRNDPVDIIQEFIVPGRSQGPIIQKLNMKTARTVSVNIEGSSKDNKNCDISDICNSIPSFSIQNFEQLLTENNSWVKTKEDYNVNRIDGSYSISLEYTIRSC